MGTNDSKKDSSDCRTIEGYKRLCSSVDSFVKEVYSSCLTLYQKRKRQKYAKEYFAKEYFLSRILKGDVELVAESSCNLQIIRDKDQKIIA
ncbi:hypothetical protein [Trichormus azollae]|uniref:hypothetical protein n=1 Tax=Trichormus azollae TaxID=1164 RepID=UPI00325D3A79